MRSSAEPRAVIGALVVLACCSSLAAVEPPTRLVVATWNLEWFFDENQGDNYQRLGREQSAPSRAEWEWKRDTVAAAIARLSPDILALQEVENQQVLYYLTQRLKANHNLRYRIAFVQGGDFFTEQDVALLYRDNLVEVGRWDAGPDERGDPSLYSVKKHLFAHFQWGDERLTVVTAHFRAAADKTELRRRQARQLRRWLATLPPRDRQSLILLGDFNTEHLAGEPLQGTELEILAGRDTPHSADDLVDVHSRLPQGERDTHLSGKQFDRVLLSPPLEWDDPARLDWTVARVWRPKALVIRGVQDRTHWETPYYQIPQAERDISDHYPVAVELRRR